MGVVYLVKHENTGEYHAAKVLHEHELSRGETLDRFKREMRLPAKIRSEHIARITDADMAPELGGVPFLVMELLNGCDLGNILTHFGARREDEVAWILGQAAKALDKAHAINIVHRDLKPENLFIHRREDDTFITKVLDFGIAKVKEDIRRTSSSPKRHANTQNVIGTPLYMSPEQARGPSADEPPIGPACDIWSMGMVTFELLTGEPYWQATNPMALLGQIFFGKMTLPSERSSLLTKKFDHWFARSCDRDPANRWVSASKQFDALLDALSTRTVPSQIPDTLAQQVSSLTPLHLEDVAVNEPSLYRIVANKPEQSDATIPSVGSSSEQPMLAGSSGPRSRDAESSSGAMAVPPRVATPKEASVPSLPIPALAAKMRDHTPTFDQAKEPLQASKYRVPAAAVAEVRALQPQPPVSRYEPPTVPIAMLAPATIASAVQQMAAEELAAPKAKRFPQWLALLLVFIAGLGVGILVLTARCSEAPPATSESR